MKKLVLFSVFAVMTATSFAQKGAIIVGGSLGFSTGKAKADDTDLEKTTNFNITPRVGYGITDKLWAGLNLGFEANSTKDMITEVTDKDNMITVGPWARYVMKGWERAAFFVEGAVNIGFGKQSSEDVDGNSLGEFDLSGLTAGVSPGVMFWVCDHFALEGQFGFLGYNSSKISANGSDLKTSAFGLDVDASTIQFGILYTFGGSSSEE